MRALPWTGKQSLVSNAALAQYATPTYQPLTRSSPPLTNPSLSHTPLPRPYHALTTPLHARPGSDTAMPARRPPHPPPHASPRHTQAELDGVTARNAVLRSTRDGGRTQLQSADAQLTSLEADLAAAQAATPYVRGCNTVHEWLRPYA